MKKITVFLFLLFVQFLWSQKQPNAIKVTFERVSNGSKINQEPILVYSDANSTLLTNNSIIEKKAKFPVELTQINRTENTILQWAQLNEKKAIETIDSLSLNKQAFEFLTDTKKILGYTCKKAKTIINSNTIELWYTNDLHLKGAPTVLGQNLGLVLEMTRNNNFTIQAVSIEKLKSIPENVKIASIPSTVTDLLSYRDFLWKSKFQTIEVFEKEIINFSDDSKSNDSILRFANGTIAVRKIRFPKLNNGSQVFVDLTEQSNGDAYDRTGSVFVIPVTEKQTFFDGLEKGISTLPIYENGNGKKYHGVIATDHYAPPIELMRFFTPFGILKYNHIELKDKKWQDQAFYRQDISELAAILNESEYYVGVFIGNYDKGGHKVSLNITVHQEASEVQPTEKILPLFNTTNIMEMAGQEYGTMFDTDKGLTVTFTLDKPLKNVKLRYITTGHGGWENGDEFVPKKNTILLNGREIFTFVPWRYDCGSYRLYNPASGNFNNGLSSSDYSRSNWCPGTVTNPVLIDLGDLEAGTHTIQVKIPQGKPEGGSFSAWNVSGLLIGTEN
jgi:GLPGLI family protein